MRQVCGHGDSGADEHSVPVCEQGISVRPRRCRQICFVTQPFAFASLPLAQILPRAAGTNRENRSN